MSLNLKPPHRFVSCKVELGLAGTMQSVSRPAPSLVPRSQNGCGQRRSPRQHTRRALSSRPRQLVVRSSESSTSLRTFTRCDDLVKYLWTEIDMADYETSLKYFADDVLYEDMIYSEPFVGKDAVRKFLKTSSENAPEGFKFVVDEISDGEKACGFTWHCEIEGLPGNPKVARGLSFYRMNEEGKINYVRDIPEPSLKLGSFGLVIANVIANGIKTAKEKGWIKAE